MEHPFSRIKAKKGRVLLEAVTPPNCIKKVDFTKRFGNNTVVHRLILEQTRRIHFKIRVFKYNEPHSPRPVIMMSHKTFDTEWMAMEKFNEFIGGYEHGQEEWERIGGATTPIVNLFDDGLYIHRFSSVQAKDFKQDEDRINQFVDGGIHCYLKINEFGDVGLHEINHVADAIENKNIITPAIKCYADELLKEKHFRGALIEGFATKDKFTVIDAAFIGTTDMRDKPLSERLNLIPELLGNYAEKYNIIFSCPSKTGNVSIKTIAGYMISRDKKNGFSATSPKLFTNEVVTKSNIIHLDAIENKSGTVLCYYHEHEELTYDFNYLSETVRIALESYFLSESPNNPAIIF